MTVTSLRLDVVGGAFSNVTKRPLPLAVEAIAGKLAIDDAATLWRKTTDNSATGAVLQ